MKTVYPYLPYALIFLLAIGLTVLSLRYVRPADCQRFCDLPKGVPCPSGACRSGEQRAGFPLPLVIDSGAGSSPTGGWGKLGPEDGFNPITPVLDVLFYAILLWLIWKMTPVLVRREKPPAIFTLSSLLLLLLSCLSVGYLADAGLRSTAEAIPPPDTPQSPAAVAGTTQSPTPKITFTPNQTSTPTRTLRQPTATRTVTPTPQLLACPIREGLSANHGGPVEILYANGHRLWLWDEASQEKSEIGLPVSGGSLIQETLWLDADRFLAWTVPADGIPDRYSSDLYLYRLNLALIPGLWLA